MMTTRKLEAGAHFSPISVPRLDGGSVTLGRACAGHDWQLIVVYRGMHCPLCTRYLSELNEHLSDFKALGIDVVAVSADPEHKASKQMLLVSPEFTVGYDLRIEHMQALGLYISHPRSEQETDRPFAESGLYVVNEAHTLQLTDISNASFVRPDLISLVNLKAS